LLKNIFDNKNLEKKGSEDNYCNLIVNVYNVAQPNAPAKISLCTNDTG
jgi:hypothetical protein